VCGYTIFPEFGHAQLNTPADEAVGGSEASLPVDVLLCIGVIMACLTLPFAIMLKLHRQIGSFFVKVASSCRPRKVLPMPSHLKNP
jgi:hypothetical protein